MRIIDADVFAHNVVKYSHQSTKTIGQALADTPTLEVVAMSVIDEIKADIELARYGLVNDGLDLALKIIDKHIKQ